MEQNINETLSLLFQEINKNDVTGLMNYFGMSATISITFLALLFTIAAIIYSFGGDRSGDSYHLKYLIKKDLVSSAVLSIIPQLTLIPVIYAIRGIIPKIVVVVSMAILLVFQVFILWKTANTCYYFILQNNHNTSLMGLLSEKDCPTTQLCDFEVGRYDVYNIKKTLYPKIYNRVLHSIREERKNISADKVDIVNRWDEGFDNEIKAIVKIVLEYANDENKTVVEILRKKEKKLKKIRKIIKPKLQAPDRVTEICLDKLARTEKTYGEMDIGDLVYCLVLLDSCKNYSESRQDEKRWWDVFQNRARYMNSDDTYMYTLYGNILYHIGKTVKDSPAERIYYWHAHRAYECAIVVNRENKVAIHNKKYLEGTDKSHSTKTW